MRSQCCSCDKAASAARQEDDALSNFSGSADPAHCNFANTFRCPLLSYLTLWQIPQYRRINCALNRLVWKRRQYSSRHSPWTDRIDSYPVLGKFQAILSLISTWKKWVKHALEDLT